MALIFQYGSNTSSARLNSVDRLQGDATVVGIAQTQDNYELTFDIWSRSNNCAAADLITGIGRKIWGVIYNVPVHLITRNTAGTRKSLDAIEGEGSNYSRAPIDLQNVDGTQVVGPIITYLGRDRRQGIRTSLIYVQHILQGLNSHPGIPAEYIKYVRGRIFENNPDLQLSA